MSTRVTPGYTDTDGHTFVEYGPDGPAPGPATIPTATTLQAETGTGNPAGTALTASGYATAVLQIKSSTPMSGGTTINFEATVDGTTWVSILGEKLGATTLAASTTADGDWRFNVAGLTSIRARISAWSAGVTTVTGYLSPIPGFAASPAPLGQAAAEASVPVVDALDVHTCTVNATIAPTTSTTALVAVAAAGIRTRQIMIRNIGTVTVFIGVGTAATTAMWPLNVGEIFKSGSLLAVNGITAAVTGSVAVLVESRS